MSLELLMATKSGVVCIPKGVIDEAILYLMENGAECGDEFRLHGWEFRVEVERDMYEGYTEYLEIRKSKSDKPMIVSLEGI